MNEHDIMHKTVPKHDLTCMQKFVANFLIDLFQIFKQNS